MNGLEGLGIWIWMLPKCEKGSIPAIAEKARKHGVSWVAVKAGESHSNGQITAERVQTFRDEGLTVAAWWYSRPSTAETELTLLGHLVNTCKVEHLIMDAEIEWETTPISPRKVAPYDWREEAESYAEKLRKVIGSDTYLADAPWGKPKSHPFFPFQQFGAICDARMPQFYWKLGEQSSADYCKAAFKQWEAVGDKKLMPIGSNVNYDGSKHGSLDSLTDFVKSQDHDCSLWSWQHLDLLEWKALEEIRPCVHTMRAPSQTA